MARRENQRVIYTNQNKNLLPVDLPSYTVANAPDPAINEGRIIFVTNGADGAPIVAYSTGTDWLRVDDRVAINATP